ncbi:MAG TPA: hypothetical protein ENH82_15635 [bacterium]|nr:hypothetical protein [bacterium]
MNLKILENILWKTREGIAALKAIRWCDANLSDMSEAKRMDYMNRFEEKFDRPLNKRWKRLKEQYEIK